MSGQLVGEVIAASDRLRANGLTERAFHALVAIAEKANRDTRQASVPWNHICATLFGASKRTAERAVRDLKDAGLISVLRPGFDNGHGRSCAPIYQLHRLTDDDRALSSSPHNEPVTETDSQVSASPGDNSQRSATDADSQVSASVEDRYRQTGDRYRQTDDRYRHLGVVLNGSTNGSTNGVGDDESDAPLPAVDQRTHTPAPSRFCRRHPHGTAEDCGGCANARTAFDAHRAALASAEADRAAADELENRRRRRAIDRCADCDDHGWADDIAGSTGVARCQHPKVRREDATPPPVDDGAPKPSLDSRVNSRTGGSIA